MGFIDWHGNRKDRYEDVLAFAKMKEKMEKDNFASLAKKKKDAQFFGVPQLISMDLDEILKLLLKEKKGMDMLYGVLFQNATAIEHLHIEQDIADQFYQDFFRHSIEVLFYKVDLDDEKIRHFSDALQKKVFRIENPISADEHYRRKAENSKYSKYLTESFDLKSGNQTLFWQWIRYLSDLSGKRIESEQFMKLYLRFMMDFSFYLNQLLPDADIGKYYTDRYKTNMEIIKDSYASRVEISTLPKRMKNPIYEIRKEEEDAKRQEERERQERIDETILESVELDARKLKELEEQKLVELNRIRTLEREAKERAERIKQASENAKERTRLLKEQELEAKNRAALILAAENEARRLVEAEAREQAEQKRLADLVAKAQMELAEAERRRKKALEEEARRNKFISLMKCARIVLGQYIMDMENEDDMVTAGRLYSLLNEGKLNYAKLTSIFPNEAARLIDERVLPMIPVENVGFHPNDGEILHYINYAIIYKQNSVRNSIETIRGTLYITNQRIVLGGNMTISIPYPYLKKTVIYDVMPQIIEIASSTDNYFVYTADTERAFQLLRLVLGQWDSMFASPEPEPINMEELNIDFLASEDIPTYIDGIKTMMNEGMPDLLKNEISEMLRSLEFLNLAFKKYPSYKESSYNFYTYYIPEAVKILYSYTEYEKSGIKDLNIQPVYEKVIATIQKVTVAAKQRVVEIYKDAIADTTARAAALTAILGEDGFVDSVHKIRID